MVLRHCSVNSASSSRIGIGGLQPKNSGGGKLAAQNKVEAELVKRRYFVGMTFEEAAEVLGISEAKAKHSWMHARAWLYRETTAQSH